MIKNSPKVSFRAFLRQILVMGGGALVIHHAIDFFLDWEHWRRNRLLKSKIFFWNFKNQPYSHQKTRAGPSRPGPDPPSCCTTSNLFLTLCPLQLRSCDCGIGFSSSATLPLVARWNSASNSASSYWLLTVRMSSSPLSCTVYSSHQWPLGRSPFLIVPNWAFDFVARICNNPTTPRHDDRACGRGAHRGRDLTCQFLTSHPPSPTPCPSRHSRPVFATFQRAVSTDYASARLRGDLEFIFWLYV